MEEYSFLELGLGEWRRQLLEHKKRPPSRDEESLILSSYMAGAYCCFAALFGEHLEANPTITLDPSRVGLVIRELVEWRDLINNRVEGGA